MKTLLTILAFLLSVTAANAQSNPGKAQPFTIYCNNSSSVQAPSINCLWFNLPQSANWFSNSSPPANISKLGDRLFVGDAINYSALSSLPSTGCGTDWFSVFEGTTSPNSCSAYSAFSQMYVSSGGSGGSGLSNLAILGTSRTSHSGTGAANIALSGFGLANDSFGAFAWASYHECNYTNSGSAGCNTLESENTTFINNTGDVDAYNFNAKTVNLNIACGSGLSSPATFTCGSAMSIGSNPAKFANGIRFGGDPIAVGSGGVINAINMPPAYSIVWNNGPSSIGSRVYMGNMGNLNLDTIGTLITNGNAGVSCGAGTVNPATLVISNGLVTHC